MGGLRYVITQFSRMDSLPDFVIHGAPLRAQELRYQKHFHYNVYNNRDHVNSHHIYSQFQEGTMMTKGNLFMSLKGNF